MASKTKNSGAYRSVKASDVSIKSKSSSTTPEASKVVENVNPNLGKSDLSAKKKEKLRDGVGKCWTTKAAPAEEVSRGGQVVSPNTECGQDADVKSSGIAKSNIKSGKVMSLIQAFERILILPPGDAGTKQNDGTSADAKKLQSPEATESCSSFCHMQTLGAPDNLHLDTCVTSISDSSLSQESISKRTSGGGRRSRRNSSESSGTSGVTRLKKKKFRVTNQKPFKLRTEQRGKVKEVELLCKIQQMIVDQERQRLPIAQGLPWTTEEPQVRKTVTCEEDKYLESPPILYMHCPVSAI
uniref:Uncharacterized protein n=1 Tax=Kalanchoe fedtschenkoi TaxID=63787 RepID=A0A7N0ZSY3_KALFE